MTPREEAEAIEALSAEIHKCYCRAYERRFGKPYWTEQDYSKLDEATKNYDREMAKFMLEALKEAERRGLKRAMEKIDNHLEIMDSVSSLRSIELARSFKKAIEKEIK